jgi:dihydroorotate dehydrogenase electron transfer subunit
MKNQCDCKTKAIITAATVANDRVGRHLYKLTLALSGEGARLFAGVVPGQFAQFDLRDVSLPKASEIPPELTDKCRRHTILRRPFSFSRIERQGSQVLVDVLYLVLGPATVRLTTVRPGDEINLIGPLGNGFKILPDKDLAIIVAGGMGAPPLQHLGTWLTQNHPEIKVVAFAGARSRADLPFNLKGETELTLVLEEFSRHSIESHISTDDGSVGFKGFVTEALENWLRENRINREKAIIYTCGPDQMLAATAKLAEREGIDCQVSTERLMGCGIGICQSCAIECRVPGSTETVYKLCCKDGPVFDSREVVWK